MILCLDVGNSHIFGGVYTHEKLLLRFRHNTDIGCTSDQLGVFFKSVLRENMINPSDIKDIAIASVVPAIDYSLTASCKKYFNLDPFFLQVGVKTGIKIKSRNPVETGSDLIASAIAATQSHPNSNLIIIDFGTVTTIVPISANKEYLGAAFLPGMRTSMRALSDNAANLSPVEITQPKSANGLNTAESIQAGLYFGHTGAIKEITKRMIDELFPKNKVKIIATGGFSYLFENEKIFDHSEPNLVLEGLRLALEMNKK